ncbi:ROK family protein [Trueperella pyogenes]|uniref:ROK family protein n=1 Tax=Trueperella pyogenes TaxID=1661 RepID=UPI00345DDE6F
MTNRRGEDMPNRAARTQAVLSALRSLREATKTTLAEECAMSRPTVAAILDDLERLGVVTSVDSSADGGRPAQHYGFTPRPGIVLAVDIRRESILATAATIDGHVVGTNLNHLDLTSREKRFRTVIDFLSSFLAPLSRSFGPLLSATVSTTGIVDDEGTIVRSDLVPQWAGFPLAQSLTDQLGCPVRVENDINASAYAEYSCHAAEHAIDPDDDLLYLSFTRGLLAGLVLGGNIHRGYASNAGEITDVLGDLTPGGTLTDSPQWAANTVTLIGPLCLVIDPRLVVITPPQGSGPEAITDLEAMFNRLRPLAAPPLQLAASTLGSAAACIGALALAIRDADVALIGTAPAIPTTLHGLDTIIAASRKGNRIPMRNTNTDDATPLRVGVVGVGARAPLALNAESCLIPAKIVAACEPHVLARQRVRERLQRDPASIAVTSTVTELIDSGVDVAFVTSPDDTHAAVTCELLEAGVAVYLEKPLAITLEDATRILATAHRTGTKLYLGHNMRHMNVVRKMRDLIREGRIGQVKAIWCRHFVGSGGDFYFKDWHATREHGTGLLLQKAAHDIDVMHWLAGAHTTDVVGMGDLMVYGDVTDRADHSDELMGDWFSMENWPPLSQQGLNKIIDVEDLSMMFMRMNSGVLASYQQCHFTPDYWRNYTVIGTEGRIENFGDGEGGVIKLWNKRTTYNADGDEQFPIRGDAHGHSDADKLIVDEFLRFVTQGTHTDTNPLGAWYAVAAGIQATESLRDGSTPRKVPELPDELVTYFTNNQVK